VEIREDRWLSVIFGHPVFSLGGDLRSVADGTARELIGSHADRQLAAMYYAKVDTGQVDVVRQLAAAGFYVVDVNVTFGMEAEARPVRSEPAGGAGCPIREIEAEHHEATLDIAARCFRYSRFHLDPLVPRAIADRIKREWVFNYIRKQRGEQLFVALSDGRPVGFLAVLGSQAGARRVRTIDLIGVDETSQGRGIGQALVAFFVDRYRGECDYLQVGTQAANLASLSLYHKCGFAIARTQYVLHMHVRRPGGGDSPA